MTQTPAAGEVVRVDPTTQLFLQTLDAKPSPKTATKLTKLAKIMTMPPLAARPLVKEEAPLLVAEWEKNQKGKALVDAAMGYRGTPYRRGASLPSRGFDCSGLVYHVLKTYGINSPRTAAELFGIGTQVVKSELREGDLVFFANTYKRGISHVGIYLGSGRFIHASSRGGQVTVNSLDEDYYAKHYAGARRVMKE
jgi:cell wall-associated NlpC family hydrolase